MSESEVMIQVHIHDTDIEEISKGQADWRTVVMGAVKEGRFTVLGLESPVIIGGKP